MPLKGVRQVKDAIQNLTVNANKNIRGIMFQTLANIQIGTPRDTGRAANNWFISVGSPSDKSSDSTSGNKLSIEDLPKSVFGQKFYYTNNLPYIERLEYGGHSQQAPKGWVRAEIKRAKRALRKL